MSIKDALYLSYGECCDKCDTVVTNVVVARNGIEIEDCP